ncbi:SMI1/KNR4 family protein [Streptomyces milbemycinicus]|uniref:SMI1/KNR4 family protein n=1 Tax=Streptomyces milbemycinicus TaxID=476552 RepID=UPI0033EE1089
MTGRTLTDKVLMPLLVRTAVFTGKFGVPLRTSGFHKERLPRPASAPLPQAVAAALAARRDGTRWLGVAFAALDADFPHLALTALDRALAAGADPAVPELWRAWLLRSVDTGEALAALDRAAAAGGGVTGLARCLQGTMHQLAERDLNVDLKALRPLLHALERSLPDEATAVELDVHAAGWFEALTAPGVRGSHRRNQIVHVLGRPGDPCGDPGDVPGGPDDPTEAGDPAEAPRLLRDYLRLRADVLGGEEALPASDPERADRFASLAREYGTALPADLRALYDVGDGDGDLGLLDGFEWFTVSALEDHLVNRWWTVDIHENAWIDGAVSDSGPHAAVRRSHDRPGWIPFAYGSSLDHLAVDLDPAENGRPGQVIRIGTRRPYAEYVADSVTSLLRGHVEALRRGRFTDGDGYLKIDLAGMGREDDHDGACHVRGTLDDADIGERTLTLDARANGALDLAAVRNAPLLRQARLLCGSADLAPLNDVPVRTLDLDLRALDLAPLAGHATLRTVTLKAPHAVDLKPLLTVGQLNGLDLSQATVRDITVLGGLRRLRHLSLRYEQWQELWATGVAPPALTVAILDGDHSPSTRAEWLNQLTTTQAPTARQYIGAFPTTGGVNTRVPDRLPARPALATQRATPGRLPRPGPGSGGRPPAPRRPRGPGTG